MVSVSGEIIAEVSEPDRQANHDHNNEPLSSQITPYQQFFGTVPAMSGILARALSSLHGSIAQTQNQAAGFDK